VIRALLVDDERLARLRLRELLAAHPGVQVVGEADSVPAAVAQLQAVGPVDLVFLDVRMPGLDGFALLDHDVSGAVVFVTAHAEFAVRAFDVRAVDYLLKPVEPARLAATLERVMGQVPAVFLVNTGRGGTQVVRAEHVHRVSAAGDYSELHLADGRVVLSDERLRTWEQRLVRGMVRVHRSHLVAVARIACVERGPNRTRTVRLCDGVVLPVARARLAGVLEAVRRGAVTAGPSRA
jgi:two-component system LytT family response regulator